MKIIVKYQSRGGNTKAVAEIIAKTLGVDATSIDEPLVEHADVLFIGGGVYMFDIDKSLEAFMNALDASKVGVIVPYSTTGGMKKAIKRISNLAIKQGIKVSEQSFCLKLGPQGHTLLGQKGGALKEEQISAVQRFAKEVMKNL